MPLQRLWPGYGFDLDGTLIDTAPDLHRALNHALAQHGHQPVEEAHTRQFIGHGALVMIERALEHHEDAPTFLEKPATEIGLGLVPPAPPPEDRIGPYRVERELAQMGVR